MLGVGSTQRQSHHLAWFLIIIIIIIIIIRVVTDIYVRQDDSPSLWLYLFETCPLSNPRRCRSILDVH